MDSGETLPPLWPWDPLGNLKSSPKLLKVFAALVVPYVMGFQLAAALGYRVMGELRFVSLR